MADEYIVVDGNRNMYYFDQEEFYKFVNGEREGYEGEDEDDEDKEEYVFLSKFPLPTPDTTLEESNHRLRHDEDGHPIGVYCPFSGGQWDGNELFVMKNGVPFIPDKKVVEKTVSVAQWVEPTPKPTRTRTRTPAQKAARRRR